MSVWVVEQKRSVSSVLQVMRELQTFKAIKQQHRKLGDLQQIQLFSGLI